MMKLYSEACERNALYIGDVLEEILPAEGVVLEVGSGTGQHAVAFSRRFPRLQWQPTNAEGPEALESVRAYAEEAGLENLLEPRVFDLLEGARPLARADAVVSINVLHIAPWEATARLFEHAAKLLPGGAPLVVYGPFRHPDRPLEPSNQRFDEFLRARDPRSGLRRLDEVMKEASAAGFRHEETRRLPANNDVVIWRFSP